MKEEEVPPPSPPPRTIAPRWKTSHEEWMEIQRVGSFFDSVTHNACATAMWVSFVLRCRYDGRKDTWRWRVNSLR